VINSINENDYDQMNNAHPNNSAGLLTDIKYVISRLFRAEEGGSKTFNLEEIVFMVVTMRKKTAGHQEVGNSGINNT
jgi:hypothetical protein